MTYPASNELSGRNARIIRDFLNPEHLAMALHLGNESLSAYSAEELQNELQIITDPSSFLDDNDIPEGAAFFCVRPLEKADHSALIVGCAIGRYRDMAADQEKYDLAKNALPTVSKLAKALGQNGREEELPVQLCSFVVNLYVSNPGYSLYTIQPEQPTDDYGFRKKDLPAILGCFDVQVVLG